jgi:hypothetical protein
MKSRNVHLDITKGVLTLGMVGAHLISFCSDQNISYLRNFAYITNLVSFSGFLFSFGYGTYLAYFGKKNIPFNKIIKSSGKILLGFYISGIAYRSLLNANEFNVSKILDILLLRDIPGYSEFLPAFAIILIIGAVLHKTISHILNNRVLLMILVLFCLSFTKIDYGIIKSPQLALILGTTEFPTFPVVQYFPLFLLGMYFAKNNIIYNNKLLFVSSFTTIIFIMYSYLFHHPSRFPPSILWIVSSAALVYLYFLLSYLLYKYKIINTYLSSVGSNILFYLVVSNSILFTIKSVYPQISLNTLQTIFSIFGLLAVIHLLISFVNPSRPVNQKAVEANSNTGYDKKVFNSKS